jgi:peptidoglycan hydrolase CwlO-like protein
MLTSRVVSTEKDIKESQRKITEVESGIQGVGNLFDNLKTVCEKNRNAVAKTEDQYEVLSVKCNKNKSDIKKLSVDIVNNSNYAFLFFSQTVFKLSNKFPTPWIPLSTSVILR